MTQVLKSIGSFQSDLKTSIGPRDPPSVISVKRYEAKLPDNLSSQVVDPDNSIATTKEEEWITKKKVELTTKKQIETRVKRQVVLEDGKVVEDSGPIVTTNTTEDTEKQEHEQTEHRHVGDGETNENDGWISVPNSDGVVKEVREKKVKTREEKEERLETEDIKHFGDITDAGYQKAIQSQHSDLRVALKQAGRNSDLSLVTPPGGRIVHQSSKSRKVVDSEDTRHLSEVQKDGRLITETRKTTEHEEITGAENPDDNEDDEYETHQESAQKYRKTKDQEFVEYVADGVKIGEEMRYEAENVEGDRIGNPENLKIDPIEWESLSERIRRMRREKQLKIEEAERRDALTKKPLNFDLEEQTRKVETNKWLEHHFGSESRSSNSSDDDAVKAKTSSSFINVTMKSAKTKEPTVTSKTTSNFKGISEWKESPKRSPPHSSTIPQYTFKPTVERSSSVLNSSNDRSFSPFKPIKEKLQSTTTTTKHVERRTSPISPAYSELESSPLYASVQQRFNNFDKSSSSHDVSSSSYVEKSLVNGDSTPEKKSLRTSSPHTYKHINGIMKKPTSKLNEKPETRSILRRGSYNDSWSRKTGMYPDTNTSGSEFREEPEPDYSPRLKPKRAPSYPDVSSTNHVDGNKKKVYQKTRFSADIPLVKPTKTTNKPERKSSISDKFRKIVGKFRTNSADRKRKSKNVEQPKQNGYPSYQAFTNVDNHINEKSRRSESPKILKVDVDDVDGRRVSTPPPVTKHYSTSNLATGTQTLDRNYRGKKKDQRQSNNSPAQKYYLGENPFNGSIYGKEKEYDGVTTFKKKSKQNGNASSDEKKSSRNNSAFGSRLSKSTSKLSSSKAENNIRGGIQTLPRQLREEKPIKKQVYIQEPVNGQENTHSRKSFNNNNSGSMINVSVVNNTKSNNFPTGDLLGPLKPARTYRTSLQRSKSFNVQPDYYSENRTYKSNPHLQKLDTSPAPLKSPGIVTSISRSTRDLSKSIDEDFHSPFRSLNGFSTSSYGPSSYNEVDTKRRIFMKGLHDRAPELYKTIHGEDDFGEPRSYSTPNRGPKKIIEYSNSFHSNTRNSPKNTPKKLTVSFDTRNNNSSPLANRSGYSTRISPEKNGDVVNKSIMRQGNNNDYSETLRYSSKSNDPVRPSVTNTVQSFSKKTVPSKDGRLETIESSETTRVTKSHYRGGENGKPPNNYNKNGAVVLEVRKSR